jgi:serine phosphatase RsbU (regulator of sigma subunit)
MVKRQLSYYENNVEMYLSMADQEKMVSRTVLWSRLNPKGLVVAFYKKQGQRYNRFFSYPDGFDFYKLKIKPFSGYFKMNDKMYIGVLKKNGDYAVLISMLVNQNYLDQLSTISDFKMRFVDTDKLSGSQSNVNKISDMASEDGDLLFLPWPYKFNFVDYDQAGIKNPVKREHIYWLLIDYDKIFEKITGVDKKSVQMNVIKFIYFLIGLFATFIIISFFIGFRIVRVITKSINLISQGTQRIRKGDFSFRIKIKSGDQLQFLAESFNEMASGIKRLLKEEKEKQRLEEELRIARSIQLKLLPKEVFVTEEFEISAVNIPAEEIAGDYFDYFYEKGKYLFILVADVSGKGASAAFYMAELKGIINYLQKQEKSPADLICECHYSLSQSFDKATFITINMAQFNVLEKKFVFSRAGHTPALFYDAQKKRCSELYPEGVAIGLSNFSKDNIKEVEVNYKSGDILFLFSDGLSEIMNEKDEMLGVENLKTIISENHQSSADEIKQKILDFSIRFSADEVNRDDLTFIILKVK